MARAMCPPAAACSRLMVETVAAAHQPMLMGDGLRVTATHLAVGSKIWKVNNRDVSNKSNVSRAHHEQFHTLFSCARAER